MTIKRTRWTADTCECVLEYEWDDSVPQDQRINTFVGTVGRTCIHHANLVGVDRFNAAIDDSQKKNYMLDEMAKLGLDSKVSEPRWSFKGSDDSRVLEVDVGRDITAKEKTDLQAALDSRFDGRKVEVV